MAPKNSNDDDIDPLRSDAFDWLLRIQAHPDDPNLVAARDAWLAQDDAHRSAYRSVERIWRISGQLPEDFDAPAFEPIPPARPQRNPMASDARPRRNGRKSFAMAAGVAAACFLIAFLPGLLRQFQTDHMTGTNEIRQISLADGSIVTLAAESSIDVSYSPSRREVALLSGQAFFDVVSIENRPFTVSTGDIVTKVTGTTFNVRASPVAVSVSVRSGRVEVSSRSHAPMRLAQGERLVLQRPDGGVTRSRISISDIAVWRDRRLIVDGATVGEVIDTLSRYHVGAIVVRDRVLVGQRVTGVFDLSRPAEALQAILRTQRGSVLKITPYLLIVSGS